MISIVTENPDKTLQVTGKAGQRGEGPFMEMALNIAPESGMIVSAQYETYGCPTAMRCGHWITQWVVGRTSAQVAVIEADDLMKVLGGVPLGKEHCTELAVGALRSALKEYGERDGDAPASD